MTNTVRIAILGASGYTGVELLRILAQHPNVEIAALTADRQAGKSMAKVFPHLAHRKLPALVTIDAVDWQKIDLVFCCLRAARHRKSSPDCASPPHLRCWPISAFPIPTMKNGMATPTVRRAPARGGLWPDRDHAPRGRERVIVAVPGCYPTGAQLPLVPLVKAALIDADDIIVDAKWGVTGAGRGLRETSLFAEVSEGISAYGVANHRHMREIEQGLSAAAGRPITISSRRIRCR